MSDITSLIEPDSSITRTMSIGVSGHIGEYGGVIGDGDGRVGDGGLIEGRTVYWKFRLTGTELTVTHQAVTDSSKAPREGRRG